MYLPMGDLDPSDWNSTKYPGVCKPTNFEALAKFKELQVQLNRVAHAKKVAKVVVDGDIGPGTVRLAVALAAAVAPDLSVTSIGILAMFLRSQLAAATSCSAIAARADVIAKAAENYANGLQVPAKVSQPAPARPSTIVTPSGEVTAPSQYQGSASSGIGEITAGQKVFAGLALGGLVFYLAKNRKALKRRGR